MFLLFKSCFGGSFLFALTDSYSLINAHCQIRLLSVQWDDGKHWPLKKNIDNDVPAGYLLQCLKMQMLLRSMPQQNSDLYQSFLF